MPNLASMKNGRCGTTLITLTKERKIMPKYLINFLVEAPNQNAAMDELTDKFAKHNANAKSLYHHIEEYTELINWRGYVEREAKNAFNDYGLRNKVDENIKTKISIYTEEKQSGENDLALDPEEIAEQVYDDLYQSEDLFNIACEMADRQFINFHNKGLMEALDCMDDLGDYLEKDSGLWENEKNPRQIILIQATFTLAHAINDFLQTKIKAYATRKIQEFLDAQAKE